MAEARIAGVGDYYRIEDGEGLTDLKPIAKAVTGQAVRRIGRFIQLALIGAGRCLAGRMPPPETAVYFTTGSGDFEVTVEVMEHLFRDGFPPKPLSFINTVSNAACFYVAKQFGLSGRSSCIGNGTFGFEAALQLALLDLKAGTVASALVGSADIVLQPLAVHRRRLGQGQDAPLAEAAHWLWLTAGTEGPEVAAVAFPADRAALLAWIGAQGLDVATTALVAGPSLELEDFASLRDEAGLTRVFEYLDGRAYYDSRAGAAVSEFLADGGEAEALLHVNGDAEGRYAVMLVRR
jgi:hypothetical protein